MSFANFMSWKRQEAEEACNDEPDVQDMEREYYESLGFESVSGYPVVIGEAYEVSGYEYYASAVSAAYRVYRRRIIGTGSIQVS